MPNPLLVEILAAAPRGMIYIDPLKLLAIFVVYLGWILFAQWVDKDAVRVNTFRQIWNMVSLGIGALGLLLIMVLPFVAGLPAFLVLVGAYMITYVVHRNGLVVPDDRVMTPAHLQRIMREGFNKRQKMLEVKERVKLTGPDRKAITPPEDQTGRQQYAFAQDILYDALWRRAGEIQVMPAGQGSRIRLDIDGVPMERDPIARPDGDSFVSFMKRAAGLALDERRKPQKGKVTAQVGETKMDVQVKTTGSTAGEALTLHVVGPERTMKIADLGMTEQQVHTFRSLMFGDKGMMVLTAPPGHGLTTTIYSLARSHDAFLQNIQLLEHEREIDIDNITQKTYVQSDENPFQAELLKVFRSDPNVVLIPEMRDKASAVAASDGAAKKQIVYAGLPAADVFDGLARWMERVGDPAVVAKSLVAITHQRLVRKLCPVCKVAYKPDPATLQKINMPGDRVFHKPPDPQYDKNGNPIVCQGCQGSGYVGRTAVFVIMQIDEELRGLIKRGASIADIKTAAIKKGGLNLQQVALQKVVDGITSIEEVARASRAPGAAQAKSATAPATGAAKPPPRPAGGGGGAPRPATEQ